MAQIRRILGLARDVIGLLIGRVRLVKLILSVVGGATNYAARCVALMTTSSCSRRGNRCSFLLHQAGRQGRWSMTRFGAGGAPAPRPTSITFAPGVT